MKHLLILAVLLFPLPGFGQVVVGNGLVQYVTSAPFGSCSQNAPMQIVFGPGTIYTCQTGTWTNVTGGGGGSGTVTSVSGLTPLFTTSNPTTTPTFALSNAGAGTVFGNATGGSAAPGFTANPVATSWGTNGANGGVGGVEGTGAALTFAAGSSFWWPDSTGHCMHGNFNNVDFGCPAGLASPSFTGTPTAPTPAATDNSTKLATTAYVTTGISNAVAGVNPAVAVQAATAAILPNSPSYNNGVAGIGAFLTTATTNTALVVDGVTIGLNDRVLVKNQGSSFQNGVYFESQLQGVGLAWILTRALDYDTPSDMNNTGAIPVINGTVNTTTQWVQSSQVTAVGTDAVTFAKFSSNPTIIAVRSCDLTIGDGLNVISAGTYPLVGCKNDSGGTITLTGVQCFNDAGSSTGDAKTSHSGTPDILTGAVTCSTTFAAGTQSATTTLLNTEWFTGTIVADGTSKRVVLHIIGTL